MKIGDRVGVHYNLRYDNEYVAEAVMLRRAHDSREGHIIKSHDSHGLCYEVRFSSGTIAVYNPEELQVLSDYPDKPFEPLDRFCFE